MSDNENEKKDETNEWKADPRINQYRRFFPSAYGNKKKRDKNQT